VIYPDSIPPGLFWPAAVILWGWLIVAVVRWLRRPILPIVECTQCGKSSAPLEDVASCREWAEIHVLADHPGERLGEIRLEWWRS
jgi:hypothetical protein